VSMNRRSEPGREQAARDLLARLDRRVVLSEGVGILQVWQVCRQQQARDTLHTEHGDSGQGVEALRMIGVVDAVAEGRADPDATWD
jgi:hypothetical protein